ncbi:Predicted DNA-binding transcriptional regulator YafY, contains an HTH and WYL domains [Micromonospora citrea]|uniref:Predicted DNA-binding transcriptional regulator YafY, contains an HTH and WYL domains n=1 Tax=Micromonospora citrea TaxID=47855 RepID=A0A1C6VJ72_9ACTN|nr:WYL domain-containing protein [Micromonospora citrea]SCL66369.1 Predicted DNA-binding transcriptional regulator YafY, contains an HTH and WYL domains [Micromonospora citrea]
MANTSARILRLLSLLEARIEWPGAELADRLGVSARTLRRDVETLRELGYPVDAVKGPGGGYRLGPGGKLPPLVLDDDQAIAIALALQTAPATVTGIDDAVTRALTTLRQVMPARLRATTETFTVTTLRNYWEFAAPPVDVDTLQAVGAAIRTTRVLRFDYREPDGADPAPAEPGFRPPVEAEPHHLVVWAGRWYLVARDHRRGTWHTYRVDRIAPRTPAGAAFRPHPLTDDDLTRLVVRNPDRGDTPGQWQCVGSAVLDLPAHLVARWAPGGSVVEPVDPRHSRLTVGGWSWVGVAGLLITFDADLRDVRPSELRGALRRIGHRVSRAGISEHRSAEVPARQGQRRGRSAGIPFRGLVGGGG